MPAARWDGITELEGEAFNQHADAIDANAAGVAALQPVAVSAAASNTTGTPDAVNTAVNVDCTAGAITRYLPDARTCAGQTVRYYKTDTTENFLLVKPSVAGQFIYCGFPYGMTVRSLRAFNEFCDFTSDGAGWRATERKETIYGGWLLQSGLKRWRQSWGQIGALNDGSNTGLGGVDVLFGGCDSYFEGMAAASYTGDTVSQRLKVKLQAHFNPAGVTGGYGYLSFIAGDIPGNPMVDEFHAFPIMLHAANATSLNPNSQSWNGRDVQYANTGAKLYWVADGTASDAVAQKRGVDRIQWVGATSPSVNNWLMQFDDPNGASSTSTTVTSDSTEPAWDTATNHITNGGTGGVWKESGAAGGAAAWQASHSYTLGAIVKGVSTGSTHAFTLVYCPITGTGNLGKDTAAVNSASTIFGYHFNSVSGLDPTKKNVIQQAYNAGSGGSVWIDGIILYNGDWDRGVRLHNLGASGENYYSGFVALGLSDRTDAIAQFCTGVIGGATQCKLVISDSITNDVALDGTSGQSAATFKTLLGTYDGWFQSQPSKPCHLFYIPAPYEGGTTVYANYPVYMRQIYDYAEENDNCAIFDEWKSVGYAAHPKAEGGILRSLGYVGADHMHYPTAGQAWQAETLYNLLAQ